MAAPSEPTDAPKRATCPSPEGAGRWALGHLEPLNPNERTKKTTTDSTSDPGSRTSTPAVASPPLTLVTCGRFRWWGFYTQRAPGIDGGRTATLEPEELDAEYFMMRVRSDGGQLSLRQLRAIADISVLFGQNTADITDRQNIQLHWIRVEDVPRSGSASRQSALEQRRPAATPARRAGSPSLVRAADEIIDGTPAIEEIVKRYVGDPRHSNLPVSSRRRSPDHRIKMLPTRSTTLSFMGSGRTPSARAWLRRVRWRWTINEPDVRKTPGRVGVDRRSSRCVGRHRQHLRDYGYRRLRTRARISSS